MLKIPVTLTMVHMVSLFCVCLGVSGLSVGLGAVYPNFGEESPSKIVSGFGGTLNLVISLLFVLAVLVAQAVPCFVYYSAPLGIRPRDFRLMLAAAMAVITLLSVTACLIPMNLGLKAIRRLEL